MGKIHGRIVPARCPYAFTKKVIVMIDTLKSELAALSGSKVAWFLAGVFVAGKDVPGVVASLRTFVGI